MVVGALRRLELIGSGVLKFQAVSDNRRVTGDCRRHFQGNITADK